jgi:hypothetical protein
LSIFIAAAPAALRADEPTADSKFEQDRAAILAMAGEYRVTFQFQETVAVEPGYEKHEPYHAEATELVEVLEDTGDFISLQHILLVRGDDPQLQDEEGGQTYEPNQPQVVKHWRQDWTYEDTELNVFRGNRTWEHISLSPAEVAGTWTQAVYQVDDSPRYESVGRWTHVGGRSAWESGETWRPLPRREYTHRDDYHVMVGRNRHTITPDGWVHEQDNYKLILDDAGIPRTVLVHESGLNVYDRVDDVDFAAGRQYWEATRAYWQDVRAIWTDILDDPGRVTLQARVDDQRLHQVLFAMADQVQQQGDYDSDAMRDTIRQRISAFLTR